MKSLFSQQIIFLLIPLVIFSFSTYWLGNKFFKLNWLFKKHFWYSILIVAFTILSLKEGVVGHIINVIRIINATDVSFKAALSDLNLTSYIPSNKIVSQKGKNIIIISLESYERGYLSDQMASITPNMRSLKKHWNYYDMEPTPGSGWTSASLYTYLTGFPAFFKGNGNLVFQNTYDSNITSISHILKKAGYHMTYLVGNAEFAGTEDLLKAFQITNIIDYRNFKAKYETNKSWGIHDKDLFEEAKLELIKNGNKDKPFAIFMSTISTHNPTGVYDKRMEKFVNPQKSEIEFMAASVDYLVGNLIDFLESENMLSNTAIYIFPDHLKMGNGSMFDNTGNRKLFLLTNTENPTVDNKNSIYQIDLPKLILMGANVKSNATFLTDFIEEDAVEYINNNKVSIAALNNSGLKRDGVWTKTISITNGDSSKILVKFNDNVIIVDSLAEKKQRYILTFSNEMRVIKKERVDLTRPYVENINTQLSFYSNKGKLYSSLQKESLRPILKSDISKLSFSLDDFNTASQGIKRKQQHLFYWENSHLINIESNPQKKYSQFSKNVPYDIKSARIEVEYSSSKGAKPYLILYGQPYKPSSIVIHDALQSSSIKKKAIFSFNNLVEKPLIVFRNWSQEGVLYIHNYKIIGYGYDNSVRFSTKTQNLEKYNKDKNRFIAHAGGKINNRSYTNSLEALNNSYSKGFRLFELDIIKTLDNKYVAAHDWNHWSKITGYKGKIPVSEKEFLEHKLYSVFTPMNMELINKWFKEHPEAILVTDKVNEPKEFIQSFIFKERLMMELFSLEAVEEALSLGIKSVMPSEKVVNSLGKDPVSALKSLGIDHIAVSRRFIAPNIQLIERLQNNDIKVYVYNVNADKGKDENYVVNYEMDYIYGLYADNWDFELH